jgi:hypothetical protein
MRIQHFLLAVMMLLLVADANAQRLEACLVDQDGKPVSGAVITNGNKQVYSNAQGCFGIDTLGIKHLRINRTGFDPLKVEVTMHSDNQLLMHRKDNTLKTFEVNGIVHPDTIVSSPVWMIKDYVFWGDSIWLLTWDKRPDRCMLRLFDQHNRELKAYNLHDQAESFFKDAAGTIYLECLSSVYLVSMYMLSSIRTDDYYSGIRRVPVMNDSAMVYSTWRYDRPEFAYLKLDRKGNYDTVLTVKDKHLRDLYFAEFKFLSFKDQTEIRRRCRRTGEDQYDLAAAYTGFTRSIWWHPLYSPMLKQNNQFETFDHYRDSLLIFDEHVQRSNQETMKFHEDKSYQKRLIQDETTGEVYALYLRLGVSWLKNLSKNSAEEFRLSHRYVDKIRIKNHQVFYLFRPFESSQNTFLYSENTPFINDLKDLSNCAVNCDQSN